MYSFNHNNQFCNNHSKFTFTTKSIFNRSNEIEPLVSRRHGNEGTLGYEPEQLRTSYTHFRAHLSSRGKTAHVFKLIRMKYKRFTR